MATPESVIQKINLLIEDANDATGSLHSNLRDAVDSLILGYGNVEVDSLSNLHAWSKYTIGGAIIEEPVTDLQLFWKLPSSSTVFEIDYADSYEIVDNAISLVNPTTITLGSDNESRNAIKGKYVKRGNVYYIPTDARVMYGNYTNSKTIEVDKATKITYISSDSEFVGIVVSEDSNAYPQNGEQDGYKYVYNGTLESNSAVLKTLDVSPSTTSQTINPPTGYDGFSQVIVAGDTDLVASNIKKGVSIFNVTGTYESEPSLQNKSVTPSAKNQVIVPDTNYDGLAQVTVAGDADLVAGNIKKGVEIFGVTGSYEATGGPTLPTLTNPGTADDLAEDKQFIDANGNVITGAVPTKDIVAQTNVDSVMFDSQSGKISVVGKLGEKAIVSGAASIFTNVPAGEFGDASASDVAKGKTFTSANGLKVTGTITECVNDGSKYGWAGATPYELTTQAGIGLSHTVSTDTLFRKGCQLALATAPSNYGDATAADVVAGKTFTSAAGLKVIGTMNPISFTVTDDGAGNVTITSSAITDNDGNVVIA